MVVVPVGKLRSLLKMDEATRVKPSDPWNIPVDKEVLELMRKAFEQKENCQLEDEIMEHLINYYSEFDLESKKGLSRKQVQAYNDHLKNFRTPATEEEISLKKEEPDSNSAPVADTNNKGNQMPIISPQVAAKPLVTSVIPPQKSGLETKVVALPAAFLDQKSLERNKKLRELQEELEREKNLADEEDVLAEEEIQKKLAEDLKRIEQEEELALLPIFILEMQLQPGFSKRITTFCWGSNDPQETYPVIASGKAIQIAVTQSDYAHYEALVGIIKEANKHGIPVTSELVQADEKGERVNLILSMGDAGEKIPDMVEEESPAYTYSESLKKTPYNGVQVIQNTENKFTMMVNFTYECVYTSTLKRSGRPAVVETATGKGFVLNIYRAMHDSSEPYYLEIEASGTNKPFYRATITPKK